MMSQIRTAIRSRVVSNNNNASKMLTRSQSKNFSTEKLTVVHDMKNSEFTVVMNSDKSFLEYEESPNLIVFKETQVPDVFQGKGVGKLLAEAALDYASKKNLKMKVECTFVQHYIDKYAQEYRKFIVQ